MFRWIIIGMIVWGLALSLGAFLFPVQNEGYRAWKPVIIMTCVALFIGFWVAMLLWLRRKLRTRK